VQQIAAILEDLGGPQPAEFFHRLARFVAVLRSLGINAGTSELNDAASALARVDVLNKEQFRLALRATLVKKQRDVRVFDLAFERFFAPGEVQEQIRRQEAEAVEERERLIGQSQAEIREGVAQSGGDWAGGATEHLSLTSKQLETYSKLPEAEKNRIHNLLENYRGNPVNDPSSLIAQVVEASLEYWRYHLNRQESENHSHFHDPVVNISGDEMVDQVVRSVARDLAGEPEESLLERDMLAIKEQEMPTVTVLLRKMARRLATGLSRRYRSSRKKQSIDIRRTVRGSVRFGGLPLKLHYRGRRVQKPKLILVCDVSASMASYARLVIQFVYGLSDVVRDIETFIFAEELERITPQLRQRMGFAATMSAVMATSTQWGKTTNMAAALRTLTGDYNRLLTRNSYLIIVSDTKTMAPDNSVELLGDLRRQVKEVLWLNTLPRSQWQEVRTVVLFRREVRMLESNTLAQLEKSMQVI
ncbi:MAG: VWA domain-containing protein, partial [Desulfotomaculaceae bacterium]